MTPSGQTTGCVGLRGKHLQSTVPGACPTASHQPRAPEGTVRGDASVGGNLEIAVVVCRSSGPERPCGHRPFPSTGPEDCSPSRRRRYWPLRAQFTIWASRACPQAGLSTKRTEAAGDRPPVLARLWTTCGTSGSGSMEPLSLARIDQTPKGDRRRRAERGPCISSPPRVGPQRWPGTRLCAKAPEIPPHSRDVHRV
jgi:hypothetical protein